MKILYVDLQYDYGKVERGINQIGEIGFRRVFESLGHRVDCFYYDSYLKNNLKQLQKDLLKKADESAPDLVYFCLYTEQFAVETLRALKSKYKTINWFGDDQWRFEGFTAKYAKEFTFCITTDPFAVPKYKKLGVENVILSQWAALNSEFSSSNEAYSYDVSFVGGANGVRKWVLSEFEKAGLSVAAFGHGWPNGSVSLDQMSKIFRTSKVNLNLSNSINYDLRYLTHSWKNIVQAFRSKKNVNQMKARNFEIAYFGGFQITDYLPTVEMYYDIGQEIICYASVDEAIQLTKFYLENDELRESIKTAAIKKARNQHTYLQRFEEIFNQI
jgi:spore maturation protein CgeB